MEFVVDIEPLTSCMRILVRGMLPDIDPYVVAATVLYHDKRTVELKGVTHPHIPPEHLPQFVAAAGGEINEDKLFLMFRAPICRAFYLRGVDSVIWTRRRRGRPAKLVKMDTRRNMQKYFGSGG